MKTVRYPRMRIEVMSALASLADSEYQQRVWANDTAGAEPGTDNLTMCIHSLYDDNQVLPDPSVCIGQVLVDGDEIGRLRGLGSILDRVLNRHGDAPINTYLSDPEWSEVQQDASRALLAMVRSWALPWPADGDTTAVS